MSDPVSVEVDGRVAIVTIANPPVNAASQAVRAGLMEAFATTETNEAVQSVVLICDGRTFVAGADIKEFGKPPVAPDLPDVVRTIEQASKPWIAAIHGTALGGGLEIALGCRFRVADASAKMGLPEVNLGIIPGAGGTVRLPRVVSAETALDMVTSGKPIGAARALDVGLVDAVSEGDLRTFAIQFAASKENEPMPDSLSQRSVNPVADDAAWQGMTDKIRKRARGQHSPAAAVDAIETALKLPFDEALAAERALFKRLKDDPQSKALRHIFFAERSVSRIPEAKGVAPRDFERIGIIGGGTMGSGIATACLLSNLSVIMIERDQSALEIGLARVRDSLTAGVKRGLMTQQECEQRFAMLSGATEYTALSEADLVVEAVFEDMAVKHDVFKRLDTATKPDAILASNTSYLDVNEIASVVRDPSRVIGLHFFSPAHIMKLLELIVTKDAAPDVLATGLAFGKRLRKITVPAGVCDGFIGNRVMSAYRRAGEYMIEDGAMPWDVDEAMRDFGFPMGLFEVQDLAGLDIAWAMRKRQAVTRDPNERYVDIADQICERGHFGRKTGRGWYRYEDGTREPDPEVAALILESSQRQGITRRYFSADEIIHTLLEAMTAQGAQVVEEGIAASPEAVDVVMVNGYGFPRWLGGPMALREARALG